VQSELRRSFEELVLLQSKSPLSINAEESAKSLTLNLTSRSVDYTTTQLELTLLDQAVLSLERGEMAGLARIAEKSTDPLTRILITQIADLQAQAQLQERADSGAYKHLLQQRGLSLREARQDLTEQRNGLILALAALGEDGRVGLGQLVGGGDATLSIDPASTVLVDTITRLGVKRAEYLSGDYLPEHPEVVRVDEAIARNLQELQSVLSGRVEHLRVQIDHIDTFSEELAGELEQHPLKEREEIAAALERFRVQVLANLTSLRDSCQQQVASLSHEIEKVERDLARLPSNEKQQLSSLQRVENAKLRVADLLEARDMVRMKNAFVQAPAEVVDPATPPARRDSPRLTFTVALALLMGLVIGLMLALVRDRVHGTVLGASEFERALGLSILGRLPDFGPETGDTMLRRLRRDLVEEPHGLAASSFRSLRTNLGALLSVREGARVLGITSTVDGEGKTSTSFGIAGALARSGQRTLLIDTTGVFDDGKKPGLLQMIEGGRQDVLRRCGIEGLDILLSGGSTAALADALDRAGENPLRTVAAPYDAVIVDLPSIDGHGGKRGETLSIARHLCALAIVSRRRTASRLAIRGALRQLDRLGTPVLGAVFNEAPKCRWRLPLRLPTRARSRASGLRRAA
jgi:Mrp family chromosome partitioning ATPase